MLDVMLEVLTTMVLDILLIMLLELLVQLLGLEQQCMQAIKAGTKVAEVEATNEGRELLCEKSNTSI